MRVNIEGTDRYYQSLQEAMNREYEMSPFAVKFVIIGDKTESAGIYNIPKFKTSPTRPLVIKG